VGGAYLGNQLGNYLGNRWYPPQDDLPAPPGYDNGKRCSRRSDKDKKNDIPSFGHYYAKPTSDTDCEKWAANVMLEQFDGAPFNKGAGSAYSKLVKWCEEYKKGLKK
jgi:hypothetical protein